MRATNRRTVLIGLGGTLIAAPTSAADKIKVGAPAPDFLLDTFDGRKFSRDELRGKVVILNFWATWCPPCRAELPVFEAYLRGHPGTDLRIFAVNTEGYVPQFKLRPWQELVSFPLVHKIRGSKAYAVIGDAVPSNFVIDRGGIVRHAAAGSFDAQSLDALVTPLLAESWTGAARPT